MARPNVTRTKQRVQVESPTNAPNLNVVAPMNVDVARADAGQGWGQLLHALNVTAPMVADRQQAQDKHSTEQGIADEQLGKADKERIQREQKYADGVEQAHVIKQTSDAIAKVDALASEALPTDATIEEKMHWVDAHLGAELGPLANDPKARLIIHQQVQDYMEKFAGREVQVNRAQNQATVQDAWEVSVRQAIEGDNVDIPALVNHGAAVFPGGRSEAWQTMVEIVSQHAEEAGDESILGDLLPARVQTEDGQSIDSPILSKTNKARIELARARIQQKVEQQQKPLVEWQQAQYLRPFEDMAEQGMPLSLPMFEKGIKAGITTAEKANGLINKAMSVREEKAKKDADRFGKVEVFTRVGAKSWLDTVGITGGAKNPAEAQDLTNQDYESFLRGYAVANKIEVPLTGDQLKKHPEVLNQVFTRSQTDRLGYEPLRSWMMGINPSMGKGILDRLDVYRLAKGRGVESMYVDEDTQALFETALAAQAAGEKDEAIQTSLLRTADPATRQWAQENREKAHKAVLQGDFNAVNAWFDADTKDLANLPVVQIKLKQLADVYLSRGIAPQQAADLARARFNDTHFAVKVNGKTSMVPESHDYDSAAAATALEQFSGAASQYAAQAGDKHPELASVKVVWGINGRGTEVHIVGSDGTELNTKPFSIPAIIRQLQTTRGDVFKKAVDANREGQKRRRALARQNLNLTPQPKY
jgi:hypothetical protein